MRELLISLQNELFDLERRAGTMAQEIGMALDRMDREAQPAAPICDGCLRKPAVEEGSYGTRYCSPCWKEAVAPC